LTDSIVLGPVIYQTIDWFIFRRAWAGLIPNPRSQIVTSSAADNGPWPTLHPDRLAAAVATLAGQQPDAALRAQLSALATVVSSLDARRPSDGSGRAELERRLDAAIESADEAAVIEAATSLARSDRAAVQSVDWSAVSGG
jgi:hypothetical protein